MPRGLVQRMRGLLDLRCWPFYFLFESRRAIHGGFMLYYSCTFGYPPSDSELPKAVATAVRRKPIPIDKTKRCKAIVW